MAYRFLIAEGGGKFVAKFVDGNEVLFTSAAFDSKAAARQAVHTLQAQAAPAEVRDEG